MSIQTKNEMVAWLEANVANMPTLEDMSSHVGYSPYYCSTEFRKHSGMTFKKYLSKCRLRSAACDLLTTEDKVIDVAVRYGYSSPESLTRAFSAEFGCSPRCYRIAHNG